MDVKTAGRVLDVFEAFADLRRALSLSELARKLGIPVSSCFGLVRTIEARGYLYSTRPRGGLYPTKRMFALARTIAAHDPIAGRVAATLQALRDEAGETVLFAKRSGDHAVILDALISGQRIRYIADVGEMRDLHATSIGKALLAQMPDAERAAWLAGRKLRAVTPETLTSHAGLEAEIRKSLRRGWFVNAGESVEHIFAIALPLKIQGEAYSFSLVGPTERMKANLKEHVARMQAARAQMENRDEH